MTDLRFGLGFDSHPGDESRPLFLGGVRFPDEEPGLYGHSDADVVCHAVAEGLLGTAGLGDLGEHFPEDDPAFEGIAGLDLLAKVVGKLANEGLAPESCDATVIAERPRIAEHRDDMRGNLAVALGVDVGRVSVKATRPEGLGLAGDGAGCIALVVVRPAT